MPFKFALKLYKMYLIKGLIIFEKKDMIVIKVHCLKNKLKLIKI